MIEHHTRCRAVPHVTNQPTIGEHAQDVTEDQTDLNTHPFTTTKTRARKPISDKRADGQLWVTNSEP
ncbi:hypothetical protein [Paenarthrobacter nitroguajacolicus]|uniref:hypothetical protein n=1 Tax=Paenarthrobacter nitroguajacolicus TaxID=211146 RepID=UPI0015BF12D2|nr:hypothetical protein [Paenarthrobacter nitroguajacolicus]NWL32087.1 hypothetical protein [Paenarthrobacter nitroguajacolicus]